MTEKKMFQYDSAKHPPYMAFLDTPEFKARHAKNIASMEAIFKRFEEKLEKEALAKQTAEVFEEAEASGYTEMSAEEFIFLMETGLEPDFQDEDK